MKIYIPLLAVFLSYHPSSFYLKGKVVSIQDADTITIKEQSGLNRVIRLVYIDAPELSQGSIAAKGTYYLKKAIMNQEVRVHIVGKGYYGRYLGEVFSGGTSVNMDLIIKGLAFIYPWSHFSSYEKKLEYLSLRDKAKRDKVGVWGIKISKPWAYRRKKRKKLARLTNNKF